MISGRGKGYRVLFNATRSLCPHFPDHAPLIKDANCAKADLTLRTAISAPQRIPNASDRSSRVLSSRTPVNRENADGLIPIHFLNTTYRSFKKDEYFTNVGSQKYLVLRTGKAI